MASKYDDNNCNTAELLREVVQKVEASLQTTVDDHISAGHHKHELDFLATKNSLLLTYLIELTYFHFHVDKTKKDGTTSAATAASRHRLTEMKTALDKMRGLDKKLRYQIDKLLADATRQESYAVSEDPLRFRPHAESDDDNDGNSSSNSDDGAREVGSDGNNSDDDDLASARKTVAMAKISNKERSLQDNDGSNDVYQPPRLAAVPYTHDVEDKELTKEKRLRRRLRASEVAQTLYNTYGDAPETEQTGGGADVGRQKEASRRMMERQNARTKFEEDNMIRLTVTRQEKKERKRLTREENSNLGAISDLGNLVRDTAGFDSASRPSQRRRFDEDEEPERGRHVNGKRRKEQVNVDGKERKRSAKTPNPLQAALYGGGGESKKKKNRKSY